MSKPITEALESLGAAVACIDDFEDRNRRYGDLARLREALGEALDLEHRSERVTVTVRGVRVGSFAVYPGERIVFEQEDGKPLTLGAGDTLNVLSVKEVPS